MKQWPDREEFLQFLIDTASGEIPIHVTHEGTFIYSVFLPKSCLQGKYVDDLMKWDCTTGRTWEYCHSAHKHRALKNPSVLSPFASSASRLLRKATPITILRHFEGMAGQKDYMVVNQLLSHPNDLHFEKERGAYCRLNKNGDVEKVIKIFHQPDKISVTITQAILEEHLFFTKSVLLRFFDKTFRHRIEPGSSSTRASRLNDRRNKIYARQETVLNEDNLPAPGNLRGFQIIDNRRSLLRS